MLRDLITWVLNTYLGKYLENLNSAQLSVALLSGEVELENIPIRKDALRSFNLPVEVSSGSIRKIKLHIPVRQFRTSPWCISIEGLYCVVCPKDLAKWDYAKEKLQDLEYKLSVLDNDEANWRSEKGKDMESYYFSSYNGWLKFGTNMATNIIDNIELKIFDVHFRYEDIADMGNSKVATGIKIGSLTAQSCDQNWTTGSQKVPNNNEMHYKLIELKELSVYWDWLHDDIKCQSFSNMELLNNMKTTCEQRPHNYLIKPICATARWKRDKSQQVIRSKDKSRVSCELMVPEVIIDVSKDQHGEILDKLTGIRQMKELRQFRLKRPQSSILNHPRMWWKYILDCHGFNFKTSDEKFVILNENLRYMRLCQAVILNPNENLSNEDKDFKAYFESDRDISDLTILRRICLEKVFTMGLSFKSQNVSGKHMLFHWFPNWMGWYSTNSTAVNLEQDESIKNLENDILVALEDSLQSSSELKCDAIFGYFKINLLKGVLILHSEDFNNVDNNKQSIEMQFNNLSAFLQISPVITSYSFGVSLGEVYLLDKTNMETKHPYLIKPQTESLSLLNQSANTLETNAFFQLRYENENQLQYRLNIKSKSLDLTYNKDAIEWLLRFLTNANKNENSLTNGHVNKRTPNIIKNWNQLFVGTEVNRKIWTFEIEIFAPRIIFLENYKMSNSLMVLMDFGKFDMRKVGFKKNVATINSTIQDQDPATATEPISDNLSDDDEAYMTPCSTPPASEKSGSDSPTYHENSIMENSVNKSAQLACVLHSKIYDKYLINFTNLQVLVCKYDESWQACLKTSSSFHLIDKFNITLTLEQRNIFTSDPEYPSLMLFGSCPTILIHGNEENINNFFNIMHPITNDQYFNKMNTSGVYSLNASERLQNYETETGTSRIVTEFAIGQLIIELQSMERSIAELQIIGVRAGLIKESNVTNITMAVHGLLLVDAIQSFGPDFELLAASHRQVGMDSFSGSLKHSTICSPVTPGSPEPLECQRPSSPQTLKKAIQNIQQDSKPAENCAESELNALISVDIKIVAPDARRSAYLNTIKIAFNSLDIIANQDTIIEILNFAKRTILNQKIFQAGDGNKKRKESSNYELKEFENSTSGNQNEICFDFFRLNVLLLYTIKRDHYNIARKVGTLTLTEAKINASLKSDPSVIGSLGGIQVIDITPEAICHQRILSVGRDQTIRIPKENRETVLSNLSNEIYLKQLDDDYNGEIDALSFKSQWNDKTACNVVVRVASVSYTHCPRFLQDVTACITYFKQSFGEFVTSLGNKASDIAKEFVQQIKDQTGPSQQQPNRRVNTLTSLDIIINSPVIILPTSSGSSEVLVANLGKISCSNYYVHDDLMHSSNDFDQTYAIEIKNINLFSLNIDETSGNDLLMHTAKGYNFNKRDANPILHDTAVNLNVCTAYDRKNVDENKLQKIFVIGSMVETLKVSLYRKQYEQLIESIRNATNFSTELSEDIKEPEQNRSSKPNEIIVDKEVISTTTQFSVPVFEIHLQNEHHDDLINVTFKDFNVKHDVEGSEKNVEITLKSVLMEDLKSDMTSPFRNMVTSVNLEKGLQKKQHTSLSCPDLPRFCRNGKTPSSSVPSNIYDYVKLKNFDGELKSVFCKKNQLSNTKDNQNLVIYKSHSGRSTKKNAQYKFEQNSSIHFNCLNLAMCVDRWYTVFDFFGLTSESDGNNQLAVEKEPIPKSVIDFYSKLKVSIKSLNFTLIRNESLLSRLNVSNALFVITQEDGCKTTEGCLGSLAVYDLTKFGQIYKQKFQTSGPEALNFVYKKKLSNLETLNVLESDSTLRINMASVHYIHTKRFVIELQMFVKELLQLQTPVMRKLKKQNPHSSPYSQPSKIKLFIQADSPVIVLPASYNKDEVLIANLGQLNLVNNFHFASDECIISKKLKCPDDMEILDVMQIDLVNINLYSGKRITTTTVQNDKTNEKDWIIANIHFHKQGRQLFKESFHLNLQVERNLNPDLNRVCPDISIKGTVSKLNGVIDIQQYKLVRTLLDNNIGERVDDIYVNYSTSIEKLSTINLLTHNAGHQTILNLLSIRILLEDVSLLLALNTTPNVDLEPLACIHFIKSSLEIDIFSDGSQDIDLISSNIMIVDERNTTDGSNVFRNILQASKKDTLPTNSVQVEVHCRKTQKLCKYTIMLNNMRVFALLNFLEQLKNYLQGDQWSSNYPVSNTPIQVPHKSSSQITSDSPLTEFVINITDSEIIFAEQCSRIDSNAIILKSTTVISYKPESNSVPLSIDINHLEIFSCTLDAEDESALSIIDPFTLNIELRNNCLTILIQKPLNIRLSYVDVKLFLRMAKLFPNQTTQSPNVLSKTNSDLEKIAPLLAMGFEISDCWNAMKLNNWKINDAALWLSQQKLETKRNPALDLATAVVDANCISVFIIDDCMDADVPLLEISLSKVLVNYKFKTRERKTEDYETSFFTGGNIDTEVTVNYYNRRLSGWEPVVEVWECSVKWKLIKTQIDYKKRFEICVNSKQLLKLNVTSTFIELFNMVLKNWTIDFNECSLDNNTKNVRTRTPFIPFALQNLTGTPLLFKPIYAQVEDVTCADFHQMEFIKNWLSVQPNETKIFDFVQKTKLRHIDSHQLNLHQILVQIHGWTLIGPISVDKVGVFFRTVNLDPLYTKKTRIVFDISLIGSAQKLIKVKSSLSIINKLDREIFLKMILNKDQCDGLTSISAIGSNDELCLPLKFIDASLYIAHNTGDSKRKVFASNYEEIGFSNNEINWKTCDKENMQKLQTCYDDNKSTLYTLININKELYPSKENLPGHTITLLPPLKLNNMLCCDIVFKIHEFAAGRINASESTNLYNVNVCEPFNLNITLDNFHLSGQLKIPMSHSGIVEPKLKLIDTQNRELHLRISIQSFQGKGMEIYISAPVWIINKAGLPLIFKQEGTNNNAAGQFEEHETARQVAPLMFSFSDQEGSPALEVRLGKVFGANNTWCKSFIMHKTITHRELRAENTKGCYAIGITVRRGRGLYACTTFVILSPRFQLYNKSGYKLEFIQHCDINAHDYPSIRHTISAPIDCNFAFHWPNCDKDPVICVRIPDVDCCCWSKGIPINSAQSLYINIRNEWGEMFFLRLEVISKDATYILLFTDARCLPPPIRIDNCAEVAINFSQLRSKPVWATPVRAQSSLSYVLDDPFGSQTLLLEAPGGNMIEFPINKPNITKSLTYSNFIYIAFQDTFDRYGVSDKKPDHKHRQLVLGVRNRKVVIVERNSGDRSQLWLMNSNGQLEHEGSTPPIQSNESNAVRFVLDLEKPPNPTEYTTLVIRTPNKQRATTQQWRFENGRLMCHANMCVQFYGKRGMSADCEAVLGRIEYDPSCNESIPSHQHIVAQKLRPGSGQLEISTKMDGPICTVEVCDIKMKQNSIHLAPDLVWTHASINNRQIAEEGKITHLHEYQIFVELLKGIGISIIARKPCEEIMFISLDRISCDIIQNSLEKSLNLNISYIQIDNQLLDAVNQVALHTCKPSEDDAQKNAVVLKLKMLPSPNNCAIIFKYFTLDLKPYIACLEEKLILKVASFLGYGKLSGRSSGLPYDFGNIDERHVLKDMKRYYFENISIGSTQVRLSAFTSSKLPPELLETKKSLGLILIKFEDALIELDSFTDKYHFETMDVYLKAMKTHYVNQVKWHAASILGSVDFLGNPLGFANDLSEGVSGLIFEGSVKSLVKNVAHGISNSTAKLTETLSDSLGKVVLDEHDNEARQRILEIQTNSSSSHLAAGLKGFGFGLLGGVTSIVRHTYDGAQSEGVPGFLSGLGKGIVGTVTKPIIGMLDLASETASAVRETSRDAHRNSPGRKRLPRCVTGAPGGLLPLYSSRQSKGQQYLYHINRKHFTEKIISYEPNLWSDREARLRLLVSTEYIRIFSLCDNAPTIMFECHLGEILSCHPLVTNSGTTPSTSKVSTSYYIEISTNLPKVTRPRIRCRTEECAEAASRCINYAKSVFDEREHTVL
ncbi:uncharacterized protein Dwil_GK18894 [Drosophila willistoni]|uniref:UBA domain-containing protein n=1 Tax=Drosophila willistoni TaxID=7260 RepID=B4MXM9_DROWI|nr:vacuolar protein sorting-associated protein 13D [Drosophila willistoni]EDW76798.1 uncharacterized protein Dwil_GK18894 [Drosophila willistoni]